MVRCKVVCVETAIFEGGKYNDKNEWVNAPVHRAKFRAVTSGSEENKRFFIATPGLQLEIGTTAEQHFEVGKEYFLDILGASGDQGSGSK